MFGHNKRFVLPSVGGATRLLNLRQEFSNMQKSAVDLCQVLRMIAMGIRVNCRYALSEMGRCFYF